MHGDPLVIDHRSYVQDTAFFLQAEHIFPFWNLYVHLRDLAQATSAIVKGLDTSVLVHSQHSLQDVQPFADR